MATRGELYDELEAMAEAILRGEAEDLPTADDGTTLLVCPPVSRLIDGPPDPEANSGLLSRVNLNVNPRQQIVDRIIAAANGSQFSVERDVFTMDLIVYMDGQRVGRITDLEIMAGEDSVFKAIRRIVEKAAQEKTCGSA